MTDLLGAEANLCGLVLPGRQEKSYSPHRPDVNCSTDTAGHDCQERVEIGYRKSDQVSANTTRDKCYFQRRCVVQEIKSCSMYIIVYRCNLLILVRKIELGRMVTKLSC